MRPFIWLTRSSLQVNDRKSASSVQSEPKNLLVELNVQKQFTRQRLCQEQARHQEARGSRAEFWNNIASLRVNRLNLSQTLNA